MKRYKITKVFLILSLLMFIFLCCNSLINKYRFGIQAGDTNWQKDIAIMGNKLPKLHKNLFFKLSKEEFEKNISDLKNNAKNLSEDEIKVEMLRIIASVGDSHTTIRFSNSSVYLLRLYWFEEGLYVIAASEDNKELIGSKLESINGKGVDGILEKIRPLISYENEAWFKNLAPIYIVAPDFLRGLKIIEDTAEFRFTKDNKEITKYLEIKKGGTYDLVEGNNLPQYVKNSKKQYWFEYIEKEKTMYFQYNQCMEMKEKKFTDFNNELFESIDKNKPEKIVIDLRLNGGGNSTIFEPFLKEIRKREEYNNPNKLFVIVGRGTFSSAILNLLDIKEYTKATIVGESTGGKMNRYGNIKSFKLPYTKSIVQYSTTFFSSSSEKLDSIIPDIVVDTYYTDFEQSRDLALEKIFSIKAK